LHEIIKQSILVSKNIRDDHKRENLEDDVEFVEFEGLQQSLENASNMPCIEEEAKWECE